MPLPGHCPVCAEPLARGRVVACARCDAGHHLDCIEYGGSCAIYGCGSRAYRTAALRLEFCARPPPEPVEMKLALEAGPRTIAAPVLRVQSRIAGRSRVAGWA